RDRRNPIWILTGSPGFQDFYRPAVQAAEEGGQQTQLEIKQHNFMLDNDNSLVTAHGEDLTWAGDMALIAAQSESIAQHSETILERMADEANDQIPKEWWIP
ncbi:hypothetical protein OY671_010854, partial [Metschnikowia pulcherrima]